MIKEFSLKRDGNLKLSEHFLVREFACKALASDMSVVDMIQGDNFRALCQIGIICCAIYNENGFYDAKKVSREEVEHAFENLHRFSDYGENGGQHEIE